jgi:hypothetical protein
VRDGTIIRIGQGFAKREGAALLDNRLGRVALLAEYLREAREHPGLSGGIVLQDLKACLKLRLRFAVAAEPIQHIGADHPCPGDVFRGAV